MRSWRGGTPREPRSREGRGVAARSPAGPHPSARLSAVLALPPWWPQRNWDGVVARTEVRTGGAGLGEAQAGDLGGGVVGFSLVPGPREL